MFSPQLNYEENTMESLSFKDALFLAAELTMKEGITLPPNNKSMRSKRIKELINIADEIQKATNQHLAKTAQ